jgi:hypothetical protein
LQELRWAEGVFVTIGHGILRQKHRSAQGCFMISQSKWL